MQNYETSPGGLGGINLVQAAAERSELHVIAHGLCDSRSLIYMEERSGIVALAGFCERNWVIHMVTLRLCLLHIQMSGTKLDRSPESIRHRRFTGNVKVYISTYESGRQA